jgi:predicted RecB family nuclease
MAEEPPSDPTATPGPRHAQSAAEGTLTKREFLAGLQCHKQLWWRVHEPSAGELIPNSNIRALMDTGRQIGVLAREYVPGGRLIEFRFQTTAARVHATQSVMQGQPPSLYQATFAADGLVVHTDILERTGDGWTLIQVKSTVGVKEQHLTDVAVQAHVLRASGINVRRVEIMHLNRDCRHPDLSNLFIRQDVTHRVAEIESRLDGLAQGQVAMLHGPLPEKATGDHCSSPHKCPFWCRCWPEFPPHHVSTVHGVRKNKVKQWQDQGWHTVQDLPEDLKLSAIARRQAASVRAGRLQIEDGLAEALDGLRGPLAFLDFEAVFPPIPRWPGCGPYTHIPVQLSCHTQTEAGHRHSEWIADGPGDPRPQFAEFLIQACSGAGTILVYNAGYETACVRHLAQTLPSLAAELADIENRLVDLLPLVSAFVYHPAFGGSFTLKDVVPALVPEVHYRGMEISEGRTASNELMRLLFDGGLDLQERSMIREALLAYCQQDTWAMVRLFQRLTELSRQA